MGVCDVSLIISDKNTFQKTQNYGSYCIEDEINEAPFSLPTLPWGNLVTRNKSFHGAFQSNNAVFASFT